ncbi:hypothetical protein Sru01_50370 [Sphaerisporangium rufum]|uniref:HIT domain-containing protein n=1 Tax=Sphaerisporangium rufum TaxID=1381558 RepID=A0A919V770_9ACTN|nr:HIT domain-containing protein [Sphaerisporangium rufum]GII80055.1 hypothetical protein Sru01_50370 [Sphaerisporangium rufum]
MNRPAEPCPFCDVLAGRAPASLAYEDDTVIVIMEAHPVNPGHVVVVPRRHAGGLDDLDERAGAHMFQVAHRVARALRRSGLRCEGVNMWLGDGEAAMQGVCHAHLHVFPRFADDKVVIDADCEPRERRLLDQEAWLLRSALSAARPA